MNEIISNLHKIQQRISHAEILYHRPPNSVVLLAVSKGRSLEAITPLIEYGQYDFGENHVQEALVKISAFSNKPIAWHFIGTIQTNKTKILAQNFSWVHTVSRLKEAEYLSHYRPAHSPPLNICLQVHIDPGKKTGVSSDEALALGRAIALLPNLRLRGLMGIPPPVKDFETQCYYFHLLRSLRDTFNHHGVSLDTLSMGMTEDLEAAIAEGATMVRIGTGIFGNRNETK